MPMELRLHFAFGSLSLQARQHLEFEPAAAIEACLAFGCSCHFLWHCIRCRPAFTLIEGVCGLFSVSNSYAGLVDPQASVGAPPQHGKSWIRHRHH
jgi:hypothetical protein